METHEFQVTIPEDHRFRRLRQLQKEEADTLEARFQKRRRLQPGEGWQALERARQIIRDEDPTATDPAAGRRGRRGFSE